MMPRCTYKRCRRVAEHIFKVEWQNHVFGEGITLCKKHINKLPHLKWLMEDVEND